MSTIESRHPRAQIDSTPKPGAVDPCPLLPDPHVLPGGLAEDLEIIPAPTHRRCT
ncbi:hypothetical protein [Amycolatopsis rhizosphaerae]|uniref:hypothetical protein n=1 Tax=Amycolatopsis rhizosphaerae TaxID=2053003 RepID=UPI001643ABD3|nr:hypothetical protein [Amycolatopsis rhizosphaerae]